MVVGPGPKEGPGPGALEDKKRSRSEGKGAKQESRRRKGRQRRQSTSIGSRHAGVHRARHRKSSAWQRRHMQQSTERPQQAKQAARHYQSERAKHARRSGLRGHYHRAPRHPVRLASLVKNRQSKWARKTAVIGRLLDQAIRVPKRQQQSSNPQSDAEVLRLITCEKQRIPLNSRSQSCGQPMVDRGYASKAKQSTRHNQS